MATASLPRLARPRPTVARALITAFAYGVWTLVFRLICLSLVTYLVIASGGPKGTNPPLGMRLEEINEAYGSIELLVIGLGSLIFVGALKLLRADAIPSPAELFSRRRIERALVPGLIQGVALAGGLLALFLAAGNHHYLGSLLQLEDRPLLAFSGVLLLALSLLGLAFCEEIVFRQEILGGFREAGLQPAQAVIFATLLYTGVKLLQLDVGWNQAASLFLLSLDLGLRVENGNDFAAGAALWGALLLVLHCGAGLPVLGDDSSGGLVLVKFQPGGGGHAARALGVLSGGAAGPIASLSFQLLLAFDILRGSHLNFSTFSLNIFRRNRKGP